MDYMVTVTDSLESIAASHDCTVGELMKLNRMSSRMVFPGQKILVPLPPCDDVFDGDVQPTSVNRSANQAAGSESAADGIRKGPGGAVPAAHQRPGHLIKTRSAPLSGTEETDSDCLQRFLKIKVKQVTESDGTVSGTLLVTPNCLMFDPDVTHPLVKENGQDLYGMVANMDEIVSVSVYKEISALTGDKTDKKKDIFDPDHVRICAAQSHQRGDIVLPEPETELKNVPDDPLQDEPATNSCDAASLKVDLDGEDTYEQQSATVGNEVHLPSIYEESLNLKSLEDDHENIGDVTGDGAHIHFR
ncbi:hypothetical protein Aduo_020000 [Ancylostoma duodenale]